MGVMQGRYQNNVKCIYYLFRIKLFVVISLNIYTLIIFGDILLAVWPKASYRWLISKPQCILKMQKHEVASWVGKATKPLS